MCKKFVFTILLLMVSTTGFAEELRLCGVEWPPFTYAEQDKIVKGISFEVYTEAFKRLQVNFTADAVPWARCNKYVEDGEYDAIIDRVPPGPYLYGTFPTSFYPLAMYVRQDFPQDTFSWDMITGKTVGVVRGYVYTDKISQFDGWIKDIADTDELLLMKLGKQRYDYAICDIFAAPILAKKIGMELKLLTPLIDSNNLYLAFNKDKADIAKRYDTIIGEMIQDGTMDTIYRTYLPYSYSEVMNMGGK